VLSTETYVTRDRGVDLSHTNWKVLIIEREIVDIMESTELSSQSPEMWQIAMMATELLGQASQLLVLITLTKAASRLAQNKLGEIIVLLRFLGLTNKQE
jgi:hypothetical protein